MLRSFELDIDCVGYWDADLATPLDEVNSMLKVFNKYPNIEMVFGARVNLLGREVRRNIYRHYIGRIFASIIARILGVGIYDTQCGAKLFCRNEHLYEIIKNPFISKWLFDIEIILRFMKISPKFNLLPIDKMIYEYPLMKWSEISGSKLRMRDFFKLNVDLIYIWVRYNFLDYKK